MVNAQRKLAWPGAFLILILAGDHSLKSPAQFSPTGEKAHKVLANSKAGIQARITNAYGKLPLSFEVNRGQTDAEVKFLSHSSGYTLFLTATEAVFSFNKATRPKTGVITNPDTKNRGINTPTALRMQLVNSNPKPQIAGLNELPGKTNYFTRNATKWRTNIPTYRKVQYRDVYPGVDLVYYGNQSQLEYDFIVASGADPKAITLDFHGADKLEVDTQGDLLLHTAVGRIRLRKPLAYQEIDGVNSPVPCSYVLPGENQIGFQLGDYDRSKPLIIDPVIAYSTYLGGLGRDVGHDIAVDSSGSAYVTGLVNSPNFPTANPVQPTPGSNLDLFVVKINTTGSALVYSTYLGGGGRDEGFGIAVDSSGNAYVTGSTDSTDFPTVNAAQPAVGGGVCEPRSMLCRDAFVAKLTATGTLVYSTYLGGNSADGGLDIAVGTSGSAYVTGWTDSANFPTLNAFQATHGGNRDAFVTKLNPAGTLAYSTYLGGSNTENSFPRNLGGGIALDHQGNVYVTGSTWSQDFPTVSAIQATLRSAPDAFVTKLNPAGSALLYSTYLGGRDFET